MIHFPLNQQIRYHYILYHSTLIILFIFLLTLLLALVLIILQILICFSLSLLIDQERSCLKLYSSISKIYLIYHKITKRYQISFYIQYSSVTKNQNFYKYLLQISPTNLFLFHHVFLHNPRQFLRSTTYVLDCCFLYTHI